MAWHAGQVHSRTLSDLRTIHYQHAAALSRKGGLDVLQPEGNQPVAVLDDEDLHFRIVEDSQKGFAYCHSIHFDRHGVESTRPLVLVA